jgi:hypothetical protein
VFHLMPFNNSFVVTNGACAVRTNERQGT